MTKWNTSEKRSALLGALFGALFIVIVILISSEGSDLLSHPITYVLGLPSMLAVFLMYPFGASMWLGPTVTEALYFVVTVLVNAVSYGFMFWLIHKGYQRLKK